MSRANFLLFCERLLLPCLDRLGYCVRNAISWNEEHQKAREIILQDLYCQMWRSIICRWSKTKQFIQQHAEQYGLPPEPREWDFDVDLLDGLQDSKYARLRRILIQTIIGKAIRKDLKRRDVVHGWRKVSWVRLYCQ